MNSTDSYYIEILRNTIAYLYKYVVPVFYILGNIGNLLSILIFSKKSWRKIVCVVYFNTCLFLNSACINSYILGSIFITGFNINVHNSSMILCKLYYYLSSVFASLLPAILMSASFDRLLLSSENVDTRLYSSKRLAYLSVSICLFVWLIYNFHILINVNIQQLRPSVFLCFYNRSKSYLQFASYSSLIITFSFCFTMIILSIFIFKNVRRIQIIPRQQQNQIRSMTKKDFQLLRCLLVQDIVYITCNIFLDVYYVYAVARMDQMHTYLEQGISDFVLKFLIFLQFIPFCVNFFIFIIISKAFRNELKRMICKMIGKKLSPRREEKNRQENVGRDSVELNVVNIVVSSPDYQIK